MTVAYNPETGEAVALQEDGSWVPTQTATNPDTGANLALSASGDWHPIVAGQGTTARIADDTVRALASGASIGFADKLDAAIKAPFMDKTYEQLVKENQARGENFSEAHPALSIGANVLGGVGGVMAAPALGVGKGVAAVAPRLAEFGEAAAPYLAKIPSYFKGIGVGAGMGAAGGAGSAAPGEELAGAEHGAMVGGGFGAVLPLVAKVLGSTVGPVLEKGYDKARSAITGTLDSVAARKVAQAFERDGIDPKTIPQLLEAYGPGATIYDVGGENVLMLAKAASNLPGPQKQMAADLVAARRSARGDKLVSSLEENIDGGDFHQALGGWIAKRENDAGPLYKKAFESGPVNNDRINAFLKDPDIIKGVKTGYEMQRRESLAKGVPFDPMDYGVTGFNAAGDPIIGGVPNMRALDMAKRGLDAIVQDSKDSMTNKLSSYGSSVNNLKKSFVSELDKLNPDYALARQAFSEPSQLIDAANKGVKFTNKDTEVTLKALEGMTDSEKAAFRIGAFQKIKSDIMSNTAMAAGRFDEVKGKFLNQLEATFPTKEAFEAFKGEAQKVLAEARRDSMVNPRVGSHTTPMQFAIADMPKDPSPWVGAAGKAIGGDWMGALKGAYHGIGDALTSPPEKIAGPIGGILLGQRQSPAMDRYLQAPTGVLGLPRMPKYSGTALGAGGLGAVTGPD
jgi:hypothetical protein